MTLQEQTVLQGAFICLQCMQGRMGPEGQPLYAARQHALLRRGILCRRAPLRQGAE